MAAIVRTDAENVINADGNGKLTLIGQTKRPIIGARRALRPVSNQILPNRRVPAEEKDLKANLKPAVTRPLASKTQSTVAVRPKKITVAPAKFKVAEVSVLPVSIPVVVAEVVPEPVVLPRIKDVDAGDGGNPQLVSIYVNDIYNYLRSLEAQYPVHEDFLRGRKVSARMRSIILDWLLQVAMKFELLPETFYLAIDLFDRYIQIPDEKVSKDNLQLVGITALFIATKYEEMYSPPINDYVFITDKSCGGREIILMEIKMLRALSFFLGKPTALQFLRRNSKSGEVDVTVHNLAKYFIELALMEYTMAHLKPSQIAAAALCLSLQLVKQTEWSEVLQHHSTYTLEDLNPIMNCMAKQVVKMETSKLQTVRRKYNSDTFMRVSSLPQLKSAQIAEMAAKAPTL
ncbi:G2/mitotic-specific cyclin-B1 [Chamberlinius hualienensis]